MSKRHVIVAVLVCAAVSIPGCALGEYESRMDAQRKRLDVIDEENRYLSSGWIEMPYVETEKKDGAKEAARVPAWPFDVFLRPPREVATVADTTIYQAPTRDVRVYRYKGNAEGTYSYFVAAALIGEEKTRDGKLRPGEFPVKVFRERVRSAFLDYYRKEYKVNPSSDFLLVDSGRLKKLTTTAAVNDRGEPLPPVEYEAAAYMDTFNRTKEQGVFQVYFHNEEPRQVAIIVQFPPHMENEESFRVARDWSLKSLEVNPYRVSEKRSAILNRRR